MTGSLPLISQILDRGTDSGYLPARGELAVPCQPPPHRTKVTLTPPVRRKDEDDIRVYVAPPETGLGTFDLGSVPASVTPPRSWRKAAWFATASSGGVVVALLFAGSALVGKPTPDQAGGAWIPGLGGGLPTIEGEQIMPGPGGAPQATSSAGRTSGPLSPSEQAARRTSDVRAPGAPASPGATAVITVPADSGDGTTSAPAASSPVPQKPPPTEAPYDAAPFRFSWPEGDPAVMAGDSQEYLDQVTENPEAAHAMTTGPLEREGSEGLAKRYADVAYFEVKHVQVNQYDGKTVCTVKTVHKDGRETTEDRTLTFDEGKISSDGQ